jgi:S1-C subfamily serine protease
MSMQRKYPAAMVLLYSCLLCFAQVPAPTNQNLQGRYDHLRCAMVTISWQETVTIPATAPALFPTATQSVTIKHFGTGFYTSPDGNIVTAAHVVGNKSWSDSGNGMVVTLATPEAWVIQDCNNQSRNVERSKLEQTPEDWGADLATLKSGWKSPSWLKIVSAESVRPGEHVITLGFPALAFGSLSIYSGIVSAKMKLDLVIGVTKENNPVRPQNDFVRIQMPISVGLSGAAVIDDQNHAIAVVSMAGASSPILDYLIGVANTQNLTLSQNGQHNVDWPWAVGELARTQREFSSPGYGDSVPLSYLTTQRPKPTSHAAAPRGHQSLSGHPKKQP